MEPTDALELDHALQLRRLRWSPLWGVFIQGEMHSGAIAVVHIAGEDPFEMALSQNDGVIQALPPNRANRTFSVRILPGRLWRSGNLIDPQRPRLAVKHLPVNCISISDQVSGSLLGSARLQKLECCPRRLIMYFETVDSEISMPSLRNSPWIRGAPHKGLLRHIRRISARFSGPILGRPRPRFFHLQ